MALLISAMTALTIPSARASTVPLHNVPVHNVPAHYACGLIHHGQRSYSANPAECDHQGKVASRPHKPPVLAGIEHAALRYTAGSPAAPVTPSLTVRSPASATLVGATARISSGFVAGRDLLQFTRRGRITSSFKASSGVLTLTGSASTAAYQTALRSVTYRDADAAAPAGTRKISFQVSDGEPDHRLSNVVSRAVVVTRAKPPVAADDAVTTGKNTAININVLAHDTGPAGLLPLAIASVSTKGTKGSVSVNRNETIRYNPNGRFADLIQGQDAYDTFTYTITDGVQTSNRATVTVTIIGSDDAPVLADVETTPLRYRAGGPAVPVTDALTVSDDDDATISSAAVTITYGFDATDDLLDFTGQHGITGDYDAGIGVLVLTGMASTSDYQAALRSVEFATSDPSPTPAARTVTFTVTDSLGSTSVAAERTIDVTKSSPPPTAGNHGFTAWSSLAGSAIRRPPQT